jgi:hypothetical protein
MKLIRINILLLCGFILGCNNRGNKCIEPIIKEINITSGNSVGTAYYFFIENYRIECLSSYFLTTEAEEFIDSIQAIDSSITVGSIYYGSSMKLFDLEEYDIGDLRKYDGIEFWYNGRINRRGFHEIDYIKYMQDGKHIEIYTHQ